MAVSVGWKDVEKSILEYAIDGQWSWNELYRAAERGVALNQNVCKDVFAILDLTRSQGIPSGGVTQLTRLAEIPRPNTRLILVVGGGSLTASVVTIYNRIRFTSSTVVKWVPSMDFALKMIQRYNDERPQRIAV